VSGAAVPFSAGDGPLRQSGAFLQALGLQLHELSGTRVTGTITLTADHHTPWGIVHGGVHTTAIESAASIGATLAVQDRGQVAVGLTNTTHFLRAVTSGVVTVEAVAVNQGRSQQLWVVTVTDEQSRLVAQGDVRLQNVDATTG
jgi:uncharacterized protein (TIGR00369 family)